MDVMRIKESGKSKADTSFKTLDSEGQRRDLHDFKTVVYRLR